MPLLKRSTIFTKLSCVQSEWKLIVRYNPENRQQKDQIRLTTKSEHHHLLYK